MQYAPLIGVPITVDRLVSQEGMSDTEMVSALMLSGGAFLGSKILIAETLGFRYAFSHGEIMFYRGVWNSLPLTLPVMGSVALAYGHGKAKARLQREPGYGSQPARIAYTSPYSSGFGTVV